MCVFVSRSVYAGTWPKSHFNTAEYPGGSSVSGHMHKHAKLQIHRAATIINISVLLERLQSWVLAVGVWICVCVILVWMFVSTCPCRFLFSNTNVKWKSTSSLNPPSRMQCLLGICPTTGTRGTRSVALRCPLDLISITCLCYLPSEFRIHGVVTFSGRGMAINSVS